MSNVTTDFVATTKKILASMRQIVTTLHLIREDVKTIRDQSVGNGNNKTSQAQACDPTNKQPNRGMDDSKILNKSKTNGEQKEGESKIKPYFQELKERLKRNVRKPRFLIEVLALFGLAVYTCETNRTNNLTQQSLQIARDQNRPYVFTEATLNKPLQLNEQAQFTILMYNGGSSPAVRFRLYTPNIDIGGEEVEQKVAKCEVQYPDNPSGTILPPHQTGFVGKQYDALQTVLTPKIDQAELDRLWLRGQDLRFNGDHIYIWGGIKYSDTTGGEYLTEYCYIYLPTGLPFEKCPNICTKIK
jgi:hypothetical protein